MNGFIEFSDPPEHYTYPLTFPIKEWPQRNDPSFIGIFFSKCRIGRIRPTDSDQRAPGVYFRYIWMRFKLVLRLNAVPHTPHHIYIYIIPI